MPALHPRLAHSLPRLLIVALLVECVSPGLPAPVALADRNLPPVQVFEPERPATTPEAAPAPPDVLVTPAQAQVLPASLLEAPAGSRAAPRPPLTVELPISLTLGASAAQDAITFTLALTHTGAEPLTDLSLEAFLPEALHWPGGQAWQYQPDTRRVALALPPLLPGAHLVRSLRVELTGLPEGAGLQQSIELVRVTSAGTALAARAMTRIPLEHPLATATAGPEGGMLVSADGKARIEFAAGALTATTRLDFRWRYAGEQRADVPEPFFVFDVHAYDAATGGQIHTFTGPVTLTLPHVADWLPAGGDFTLLLFDEALRAWRPASETLRPDPETGAIEVPITHLSSYGGGDLDVDGWRLMFTDAVPNLFSGSVSFASQLDMPPGRNGMQPSLALSYNSGSANGVHAWIQSDLAGLGWSLDEIEITRALNWGYGDPPEDAPDDDIYYRNHCAYRSSLCFGDEFTLLFRGQSYRLVPDPVYTTTYHTEDASFLKIQRVLCPTAQACTGGTGDGREVSNQGGYWRAGEGGTYHYDFWKVTSQDGTVYRLGARQDSEQRKNQVCIQYVDYDSNYPRHCGDDPNDVKGPVVYRWRLDLVTDVYGNEMVFRYAETPASQQGYGLTGTNLDQWDRESYLTFIGWNWRPELGANGGWGYAVQTGLVCRHNAPNCSPVESAQIDDATTTGYGDNARVLWFQRKVLQAITVTQMTSASAGIAIREYRLAYSTSGARSGTKLPSRVLTSITPYGLNGYPGGQALPPTTFSYTGLRNYSDGDEYSECKNFSTYEYGRLTGIQNGYGADIALEYAPRPNHLNECSTWGDPDWPYNITWVLGEKTVTDGQTPALVTSYAQNWPCNSVGWSDTACKQGDNDPGYRLLGYGIVTETVRSGTASGPVLARTEHRFVPDADDWNVANWNGEELGTRRWGLLGREKLTRQLDASGVMLSETQQVYTNTVIVDQSGDLPTGKPKPDALFNHLDETIAAEYNASGALLVQTRSATTYEATYGKPVAQYRYGATRVITNGGFEGGLSGGVPAGWAGYGSGWGVVLTQTAAVLGNVGLALTHHTAQTAGGLRQDVWPFITTSTSYIAYARVRSAAGNAATFALGLGNAGGGNEVWTTAAVPTTTWRVLSTTQPFTPTVAGVRVLLEVAGSGTGAVLVDDIWLERLADTGDERAQKTWYMLAGTGAHWVVGLPKYGAVYTGTLAPPDLDGTEAALTAYGYDGTEPIFGTVITGALTAQRVYTAATTNYRYDYAKMITTTLGYDGYGNQVWSEDALGRRSTTGYDPVLHTFPTTFTNALTQTSYLTYDLALGKVVTATDANNVQTWLVYDAFGRLTKVVADANSPDAAQRDTIARPTLQYVYSDTYQHNGLAGLRVETIRREVTGSDAAADVQTLHEFYSGRGLLVQSRAEMGSQASPQQAVWTPGYDAAGRVITGYVPYQATTYSAHYEPSQRGTSYTRTQFDILGRTVTVTGTDGLTVTTAYSGLQTAVRDASGHVKVSAVDAHGQLVQVQEYAGVYARPYFTATVYATTQYAYNVLGNLIRVTDQEGNVTTMSYDAVGHKLAMDDPDMLAWGYRYDAAGNLLTQTDAQDAVTCFDYDRLNRLVARRYDGNGACPQSATDAYGYDQGTYGVGRRTAMTNTNAIVSWTYDRRGRVTAETRTLGTAQGQAVTGMGTYTYRFGYNAANQVVTTTYPSGETVRNTYTAAWQPRVLTSTWTSYVTDAQYNVRGDLDWFKAYTGGTGFLQTSYDYYDSGSAPSFRLKQLDVEYDNGQESASSRLGLAYRYDTAGNVKAITDTTNDGQVQTFGYDALDRLTSAEADDGSGNAVGVYSDTYSYDPLGSPTNMDGRAYDYEGSGHAHAVRYASVLGSGNFSNFTAGTAGWTLCASYCALDTDGGDGVLRNGPSTGGGYTSVYSTSADLEAGQGIQIEFKAGRSGNTPDMVLALETGDSRQRFGLVAQPGYNLRVQRKVMDEEGGTTWTYSEFSPAYALENGTWYVLRLFVGDSSSKFKLYLWKRDDPAVRRAYEVAAPAEWLGQNWRVRNWAAAVGDGNQVLLDSYLEFLSASNGVWSYRYSENGNMVARVEQGVGYAQGWDGQNRLVQVVYGPLTTTASLTYTFAYDADGARVRQTAPGGAVTAYAGAYEETATATALLVEPFDKGADDWSTDDGGQWAWDEEDEVYQQQDAQIDEAASVLLDTTYGDITATVRVRIDDGEIALAGLVLRRDDEGTPAYFFGLRNDASLSSYRCGIYEKSGSTWTLRTVGPTNCRVSTEAWHTLTVRAASGRLEMYVDDEFVATWVDTTAILPASGFGLMTIYGAATFDDVSVWGLSSRSYYAFGAARVAMRQTTHAETESHAVVYYLAADHLGSTSLALTTSGAVTGTRAFYMPFGAERGPAASLPTDFTYTGGRESSFRLVHLGARWYDPYHNQFISPDTIVPDFSNPQSLNRYSYVTNSPLNHIDPTGHAQTSCDPGSCGTGTGYHPCIDNPETCHYVANPAPTAYVSFYSVWELTVLEQMETGGPEGQHAADYLRTNQVHFGSLEKSLFTAGANWHGNGTITLNADQLPHADDPFYVGLIAHEAKHLEQGSNVALSVYGELEAWQTGLKIELALRHQPALSDPEKNQIIGLPLNHDLDNLRAAEDLMIQDLGTGYLIWLLPLNPPDWSMWDNYYWPLSGK